MAELLSQFCFQDAVLAVADWLDNAGASFATRVTGSQTAKKVAWRLDISVLGYRVPTLTVELGALFPSTPCELYVDKVFCLVLPHVEEDGRVCLGETSSPADFSDPVVAVLRSILRFKTELLEPSNNETWRRNQLHNERLSYWMRFCDAHQSGTRGRTTPRKSYIYFDNIEIWSEGRIAAYIPKGSKRRRFDVQIITVGDINPVELAQRHKWANGTLINGSVAFVRIPDGLEWTPEKWPKNFIELNALVEKTTDNAQSVSEWLRRTGWYDKAEDSESRKPLNLVPAGSAPLVVVIVHGTIPYGYQIYQSTVSLVTPPQVAPIKMDRIDPSWSLIRDHAKTVFSRRQTKRILVLGCGALGSPIVEVLARSGVGYLDLVDSEAFEAPNVSRHILGIKEILKSKAKALAIRIKEEVPGIMVTGYWEDARTWMVKSSLLNQYDLVIDCTAESSVRVFLAKLRTELLGNCPVVHSWVEPYCAAAHVVATTIGSPWPDDDPVESKVNIADYSDANSRVNLPACSDGFHPYGAADILQAAGFASERIISILDNKLPESVVWSWIRCQGFFDALQVPIKTNHLVPSGGTPQDAIHITRKLDLISYSNE